ncbi:LamG domain-containing protein [Mucilaginibacter glaciei]|uniref:LamG domain-containing protein n=1 Tax=Mucilaginibacter glaciei TaxID=2772109 RepID=A0A926NL59_9SPHI|nr:LamG domain-containing protein [Mucilaginibacter glaciei]MBD1391666.1 LamG domain-containing protein [Mucilaginibacter glaciei]
MKTYQKIAGIAILVVALLFNLAACKKDAAQQTVGNADGTQITAALSVATSLYTSATEGKRPGNYAVGSRTDLKTAIDLATATKASTAYSQREVDNATANLNRAVAAFKSRLIQDVSADNLIAKWEFTGNANDVTGHGHNGTLMTGFINSTTDGGTLPALIADRYNQAGNAYDFQNGSNIEIPYTADLNPKEFTISLWVKRRETNPDNYMFSLNTYNGFKFQLQGANFLFLTFKGDNGYHDVDSNPGVVPADAWTFVSVSYVNGTMKFYVNDKLVKTAAVTGTPVTLTSPVNLVIGQSLPKSLKGTSYFKGSMDDIRFYNRALSDAEVLSIYTIEQP